MKIKKLTIIVPVYNEKATIETIFNKLVKLRLGNRQTEIIWTDDGSTDGTTNLLKKFNNQMTKGLLYKNKSKKFKFIFKTKNEGKGAAIRSALESATGDYVIIQDADTEYNPEEIVKLVELAEKKDLMVVFGSRDREIKNHYLYPHYYWGSKGLCYLMNMAFGEKFTDPETCYKLIQTDLFRFLNISERGFGVEMEIAGKVARLRIPYGEVGITYHPRSFADGKKIGVKDGLKAIYLIAKFWERDLCYGIADRFLREVRLGEVIREMKFDRNDLVVDLGCGKQANMGWRLRTKVEKYTGMDKVVTDGVIGNVTLNNGDLEKRFKYADNYADKVIGAAVIEHLHRPVEFVKECRRILKHGGLLALTTPAPPFAAIILRMLVNLKLIEEENISGQVIYFSSDQLKEIVEKADMKVIKTRSFLWGLNNLIIAKKK